jgi:hypothetical protein
MDAVKAVSVRREQSTRGHYDCIKVVIGDLHLRCDVTCDRDIKLAKRLADDHGAAFTYSPEVASRVCSALGTDWKAGIGGDVFASIRVAQVRAGEAAVLADLARMGLLQSADDQTHE